MIHAKLKRKSKPIWQGMYQYVIYLYKKICESENSLFSRGFGKE